MNHNIVSQEGREALVVFVDGDIYTATDSHPNYAAIKAQAEAGDPEGIADLFDPSASLNAEFERLTERVTVLGGAVYFDGDEVDNTLTRQVLRFREAGEDFTPLVNFFERVMTNPSEHSRDNLFRWLDAHDFTIDDEGYIIGYKGVRKLDNGGEVTYASINQGTATVDGVKHTGNIPNHIGAVVEMPRSQVTFDPADACNSGLHVGTWSYASTFGRGVTLLVKVDPRDVVSVPVDCNGAKMRTCRYTVLDITEQELDSPVWRQDVDEDDDTSDYSDYEETEGECHCSLCVDV